jgi:hypothetical protein
LYILNIQRATQVEISVMVDRTGGVLEGLQRHHLIIDAGSSSMASLKQASAAYCRLTYMRM